MAKKEEKMICLITGNEATQEEFDKLTEEEKRSYVTRKEAKKLSLLNSGEESDGDYW